MNDREILEFEPNKLFTLPWTIQIFKTEENGDGDYTKYRAFSYAGDLELKGFETKVIRYSSHTYMVAYIKFAKPDLRPASQKRAL